jgi:hypothetical protein
MTPYWMQIVQLAALLLSTFAIVGTFFVYLGQLRAMQGQLILLSKSTTAQIESTQAQLEAALKVYRAQNLIALNEVVTEPGFRNARKTLINPKGRPLSSWSAEERQLAERACGLWNFVAQLVLELEVPESVVRSMSYTVVTCHDAAAELLVQIRKTRMSNQWEHFSLLADKLRAKVNSPGL